ncbi:MAG TPA: leucyl aminopeptidase [Clostridiaceae bacterium]|nr:leucyl aminopeptidase [Clostridiaceae bacterium]
MKFVVNGSGGVATELVFSDQEESTPTLEYAREKVDFKGNVGEVFFFPSLENAGHILVGLGELGKLDYEGLRETFYNVGQLLSKHRLTEVEVKLPMLFDLTNLKSSEAVAEGFLHSTYRFDKYQTERKESPEITVNLTLTEGRAEDAEEGITRAERLITGIFLARDLVNEPANVIYPETLAAKAKEALEPAGIKVTVYEEEEIRQIGLHAFLSVAQGSDKRPRLIVMEYKGDPDTAECTAIVGKGLTYDSGGYSLKPSDGMKTMSSDMGGAATVIGTMLALSNIKPAANVTGVIAACENLVSGGAYKPGDIIQSLAGKTIEIDNADAEGRLTLADAVHYATNNLACERVIDLATLTGACLIALGEEYSGVVTNNADFLAEVKEAADAAGERIWELPNDKDFAKRNESKIADIKNSGGRLGGTISAGQFVGAFVHEDKPWVHLDIAGTAFLDKPQHYLPAGATGVHVKTLVNLFDK